MKRILAPAFAVAAILGAPGLGSAQAAHPPSVEEQKLSLAAELIEATDAQGTMRRMMRTMTDAFSKGFATSIDDKTISQILDRTLREELTAFTNKSLPLMAQVYADTFDEQELRDLLAFYHSPLGRKLIERQPDLSRRAAAAVTPLVAPMQKDMIVKLFTRFCEAKPCTAQEMQTMEQMEKQLIQRIDAQSAGDPTT